MKTEIPANTPFIIMLTNLITWHNLTVKLIHIIWKYLDLSWSCVFISFLDAFNYKMTWDLNTCSQILFPDIYLYGLVLPFQLIRRRSTLVDVTQTPILEMEQPPGGSRRTSIRASPGGPRRTSLMRTVMSPTLLRPCPSPSLLETILDTDDKEKHSKNNKNLAVAPRTIRSAPSGAKKPLLIQTAVVRPQIKYNSTFANFRSTDDLASDSKDGANRSHNDFISNLDRRKLTETGSTSDTPFSSRPGSSDSTTLDAQTIKSQLSIYERDRLASQFIHVGDRVIVDISKRKGTQLIVQLCLADKLWLTNY